MFPQRTAPPQTRGSFQVKGAPLQVKGAPTQGRGAPTQGRSASTQVRSASTQGRGLPVQGRLRPPPGALRPPPAQVRALYSFQVEEEDELGFGVGDVIEVLDSSDASWWTGRLRGRSGLFPANYTTPL